MIAHLPAPPGNPGQQYMTMLVMQIVQLFQRCVTPDQGVPRIILQSPDGRSWDVTVDSTGALTTTLNTTRGTP